MSEPPLVEEVVTRLFSGAALLFEWRCTPALLPALVVGRLYAEGLVDDAAVAGGISVQQRDLEVTITMPALHERARTQPARSRHGDLPPHEQLAELFRALFAGVDERHESGGMHAAALAEQGRIAFQAEDVGRHNAVDKVIGMALLAGAEPPGYGMLISSRISGEIARKAAAAGIAWLASRSIPTTLALRYAQDAHLPLIGRAASRHAIVYP